MKYALLLYSNPEAREAAVATGVIPAAGVMDRWTDYTRALKASGALLGVEQLQTVDSATTVRRRDGERLLVDGPFAETKEHLLGFYLIDVPDLDAALEWAEKIPALAWGTVEVRPVAEGAEWRSVLDE